MNTASPLANQPLYEEISVIGNGAYGTVYKGIDLKTSKIVAMKRIRIKITEEGLPISTIREIAYLKHLEKYENENIVKLLDVCHGPRLNSEQNIILIFEYVDYDLDNYLRQFTTNLNLNKIIDLTRQILVGIDFLHTNRIIHRDLKPQNILITKEGKVKIADFGLARIYGFTMALTSVVVTLWYRSPEVLLQSTYSASVDIWSIGCIFAELYLRRPLFCGHNDIDQLYKIFEIMGLPSEIDWPSQSPISRKSFINNKDCTLPAPGNTLIDKLILNLDHLGLDLLLKLLDFNICKRITARDALQHDYFKQQEIHFASLANNSNTTLTASILETTLTQQNASNSSSSNSTLPDITNIFQPNILKRKRTNQQQQQQQQQQQNESDE